jgi:hypothetical protein
MRDAKLTFVYPTAAVTASASVMGSTGAGPAIVIGGTSYSQGITYTQTGASAAAGNNNALELNYGGLLTNGVSNAVMDNDMSGAVEVNDYVRGQILTPIFVTSALTTTQLAANDVLTCEVHASNTLGFTPSASTVVATQAYTPPVAFTVGGTIVSTTGTLTAATMYFVTAVTPASNTITVGTSRGGGTVANITITLNSVSGIIVNQTIIFNASVAAGATVAIVASLYNDVNGALLSVPVMSYNKFLRVRWVATTVRSGVSIGITRTAIQTGREGTF